MSSDKKNYKIHKNVQKYKKKSSLIKNVKWKI